MTTGVITDFVTVSRNSTATYWGAGGVLMTAAANQPRFEIDPVSGTRRGILIEEARTNLFPGSSAVGGTGYTNTGLSVTQNAVTAPDGTNTASRIVESTANSEHRTLRAASRTSAVDFWNSVYVKAAPTNTREWVYVWCGQFASHDIRSSVYVNVITGEVSNAFTTGTGPISDFVRVERCANGWFRVFLRGRTVAAGGSPQFVVSIATPTGPNSYTGDGVSGILVWGYQTEDGLFPTSYIPTTTAQATRAADTATVSNLSWLNLSASTIAVDCSTFASLTNVANDRRTLFFFNGPDSNSFEAFFASNGTFQILGSGSTLGGAGNFGPAPTQNQRMKVVIGYSDGQAVGSVNGSTSMVATPRPSPLSINYLSLGSRGSGRHLNGHIRSISYIPRRLSNAQIQQLSAL